MITAILVDDEPKALKSLQDLLQKFCPDINIIGTAHSAAEAFDLITSKKPQLLFLDVAMPKESGFDLLQRLPSLDFELIFVTGFDKYAIDAFKFSAIGYILKPIETSDLIKAVHNASARIKLKTENHRNEQLLQNMTNAKSLSHLINLTHVKRFHREGTIFMADDSTIPVSRRRRAEFLELW